MKIICDVHVARKVVKYLIQKGVDSVRINDILQGSSTDDQDIVAYADQERYVVMSKDQDFKNTHLIKHQPKQLLKINLGNISTKKLIQILEENFDRIQSAFNYPVCLVEIDNGSIVIYQT
ncbi:MAG: DUF5615 family PIN-like protein [Bacteroidota bacterium]